ncbi:membrane protein [Vibrio metoecus]|nr:membrane protein [Vibrio metoecus]
MVNQHKHTVTFSGEGKEFFGIWSVNLLLSIITLGIYSAWAKVRTKRYFYGNTFIAGDNFEYHAQPMQILKGRLVAFAAVLVWFVANSLFPIASLLLLLVFYFALPWLLWSNARFDSAMTSFRNVHFSFNGTLLEAYSSFMGRGIVALVVLFIYFVIASVSASVSASLSVVMFIGSFLVMAALYAWVIAGVQNYFANGYRYGDWQFSAQLTTRFFLHTYLKAAAIGVASVLAIISMVLIMVFGSIDFSNLTNWESSLLASGSPFMLIVTVYIGMIVMSIAVTAYITSRVRNYIFSQLVMQQALNEDTAFRFESTLSARGYTGLVISNFLLQAVTVGIARPWVMVRTTRYLAERTAVIGDMDVLKSTDQSSDVKSAISDELAQAFDLGIGIG